MEDSTGDTTASVRLRPNPRLLPSPTLDTSDMVDTVLVDTAATAMEDSTGDTMAGVRLRPNPRLLPSPILDTEDMVAMVLVDSPTSAMEVMEDTVLVAMEDTVVTVTAMASKMFPSICDHLPLNHLAFLHSCILTNK